MSNSIQEPNPLLPLPTTTTTTTTSSSTDNEGDNIIVVRTSLPPSITISKQDHIHQKTLKYMECLKNHAAPIGGHATDGCGEFMPGGEEGTLEALKCSACNCHRNFHRKIQMQLQMQMHAEPSADVKKSGGIYGVYGGVELGREVGGGDQMKKRFRTKFSQEQKEKMLVFAEKAGWKITKMDDCEVRGFCEEVGVKRKVLKVWMHNNKYHHLPKKNNNNAGTPST